MIFPEDYLAYFPENIFRLDIGPHVVHIREASSDRWAHLPVETQLAFAKEEIEILKRQMFDVIDLYRGLPECRQYANCPGEVPQRHKMNGDPDPKDREIANLRGEIARTRALLHQAKRAMRSGLDFIDGLTKDVPCPPPSRDMTKSCESRQAGSECASSAESWTPNPADGIVGTA